jgi:hypothetical protein
MENSENEPREDSSSENFSIQSLGEQTTESAPDSSLDTSSSYDEGFSLKMLQPEKSQDQTAEFTEVQKEEFHQKVADEFIEHRRNAESSLVEPKNLAEILSRTGVNLEIIQSYLQAKQEVFNEENPELLANDLMLIENRLIVPLIEKLSSANVPETQKRETIISVREAFYGIILNKSMSGEKFLEILNGEIIFQEQPGSEIEEKHQNLDIYSYVTYDQSKKCFNIYIYNNFFKESGKDKAFLLRHEFSHAAAFSIWGERYFDFLEAAKNPHSSLSTFANTPELQQILYFIANPGLAKPFFRSYISNLLEELETSQDPIRIVELREHAAQEIVADLTAHYLEGSSTTGNLIDFRARYFSKNDKEMFGTILSVEGVSSKEELLARYNIDPSACSPDEIIGILSKSDKLSALFRLSAIWQDALSKKFANQGSEITTQFINNIDSQQITRYSNPPETATNVLGDEEVQEAVNNGSTTSGDGQTQSVGNALLGFWSLLTGRASTK